LITSIKAEPRKSNKPLVEWGVFLGHAVFPDYPGSEQDQTKTIPVPLVAYRGPSFRVADDGGASARFLRSNDYYFDISLSGSFPASSDDNNARSGMPDLNWLMEFGPRFNYLVFYRPKDLRIKLSVPWRSIYSTNFNSQFRHRGYQFAPSISLEKTFNWFNLEQNLFIGYINRWGDEKISRYFYEVQSDYITPQRPAFNARSGFLARDTIIGFSTQVGQPKFKVFCAIAYSSLKQAKNRKSPLLKQKENTSVFIGFSWRFYESDERGFL
jgi:outer membrane scaffolding protein for murein synthesis (MipA/OmpV family)